MACSTLLILGLVLDVAHCLETQGENLEVVIKRRHVPGVLGEDVYLDCLYLGGSSIVNSLWKRQSDSRVKTKRLTGFSNDMAFTRDPAFSTPASATNLTVKMRVSSVEAEGEYTCVFASDEEEFTASVFLTVLVRPDIHIEVNGGIVHDVHYQSVLCSAVNGRPVPEISWLIEGTYPTDERFTVEMNETIHPNGTSAVTSILRFPTHLQDEDRVTCVVRHPSLPDPVNSTVRVETFVAPNVTLRAEMVRGEENDSWVVSCSASGGRPEANISLLASSDEELQSEDNVTSDSQTSSYRLPVQTYEGHNITCAFDHPKFPRWEFRSVRLPSFYLSGVHLLSSGIRNTSDEIQNLTSLELEQGETSIAVGLVVSGNVPRYSIVCRKDKDSLPEGVEVVAGALAIQGPVEIYHGGLYECVASYQRHRKMIQFNIRVTPQVMEPALVPPMIRVDLQRGDIDRVMECSAADAVPAANMSWLLPEGVSHVSWFNFSSHNGSHSVRGVLLLPACLPQELTVECVIHHPALEKPENRSITLPLCAPPTITINSSMELRGDEEYMVVDCRVDSVGQAATITWYIGDGDNDNSTGHLEEVQRPFEVLPSGLVSIRSTVKFLSSLYSGQNLTCVTEHQHLLTAEKRQIHIPVLDAPVLNVSVQRQKDSPVWLAVCEYRGADVRPSLAWISSESPTSQTSLHSVYEEHSLKAKLTYRFPLALHEGQTLTCVLKYGKGSTERRTIPIPRYFIFSVRVVNRTIPLQRSGGGLVIHRLALRGRLRGQKVLLRVNGNVSSYSLSCQRRDGSYAHMEGDALVFQSEVTKQDEGLYTCQASFYHHKAKVLIFVEVVWEEMQLLTVAIISISTASAITFFLIVALWVFCKRDGGSQTKKRESLAPLTTMLQDTCSPEVKKAARPAQDDQAYAQLISYSVVLDIKSTV